MPPKGGTTNGANELIQASSARIPVHSLARRACTSEAFTPDLPNGTAAERIRLFHRRFDFGCQDAD